jgi:hypothetical protein
MIQKLSYFKKDEKRVIIDHSFMYYFLFHFVSNRDNQTSVRIIINDSFENNDK